MNLSDIDQYLMGNIYRQCLKNDQYMKPICSMAAQWVNCRAGLMCKPEQRANAAGEDVNGGWFIQRIPPDMKKSRIVGLGDVFAAGKYK